MADTDRASAAAVGGYVLAGGRSSRMGRDKALLELAGRPLIAHAVAKLRRVTGEANILAGGPPGNADFARFGTLLFDTHPDCGPIGGIEAALLHSTCEWSLILPVDVPFLPAALLDGWVEAVCVRRENRCFVSIFRAGGRPQPTVLLLHRAVQPLLSAALARGEYKLLPALEEAARHLGTGGDRALRVVTAEELLESGCETGVRLDAAQLGAQDLWFLNLNTLEQFAEAEKHVDALDPLG